MITKLSFKAQITWLSMSLIVITVILLTLNYWYRVAGYADTQIERQMYFAQNVLEQNLASQEKVLTTAASVLTADFGFKQAVATRDNNTIKSVLTNHGNRIKADLMLLLDTQGKLLTSSASSALPFSEIEKSLKTIPFRDIYARIISIDDKVFQVIVIPVKAPRTIAFTVIGFEFNRNVLLELKELLSLEITLIKQQQIIQSSIDNQQVLDGLLTVKNSQAPNLLTNNADYYNKSIPFGGSNNISVVLSASLNEIHQDFNRLISSILVVAFIVILFAIAFSRILSRGISTPLHILLALTKKIGGGNLDIPKLQKNLPLEFNELYQGFSVMGNAIEEREQEIIFQAERDLLTGLYNRHTMLRHIGSHLKNNTDIVLIYFNIKGFKGLNDTIGVKNGDDILKEIARRLAIYIQTLESNVAQENDTEIPTSDNKTPCSLAARITSDEFLLAIPACFTEKVDDFTQLLQTEIEQPYWLGGLNINLTIYIGIANSVTHGNDAEKLMRRSAMATVAAFKEQVSVRYYQEGEDEAYLYKLRLIDELKKALDNKDSPLFMTYQPKLNIVTGKVDKLEALIRWINNEGDFVNPEIFVDLAEKSGLIVTLTRWVILAVITQIEAWNKAGFTFKVSINLSAQDIEHDDFVQYLLDTVEKHNISASQITLELTERDLAENEDLVSSRLSQLKSLGFEISVDDYGIGQSSLAKLKSLPVDELKIDKCFILTLDQSIEDQNIVHSTISLGHKLGLRVVAEGVENKESLALLAKFKCDYAQGYYLSRPLKSEDLLQWYEKYEPSL